MRILHTTSPLFRSALFMITVLFLHGCVSHGSYNAEPWQTRQETIIQSAEEAPDNLSSIPEDQNQALIENKVKLPSVKVAILLPLSGKHEKLGQAMLNAAQMALFEIGFESFQLLPKDTRGTPDGARSAAHTALQEGAKLVLGPVFSPSVKAARQVTQNANINMIAFSTDWTLANNRTFLISFLPFDQIERVVRYAAYKGYKRIGVISPTDTYGNGVVSAYESIARSAGIQNSRTARFAPNGSDLGMVIRKFSDYDARRAQNNAHGTPFDAVLMPVGGQLARQTGSFLNHYDLPPNQVKRLGTGLMDDASLAHDKSLSGAWFAAPSPQARKKFERHYRDIYFSTPPRIASLAYDATALATILARIGLQKNGNPAFDHRSITNPSGFAGADGIFRFRRDGIAERGLAILEYRRGRLVVIDAAPRTFQKNTL